MSEEERRAATRQEAVVLVEVVSGEKAGRFGVTRDASPRGLLFATRTRFAPGDRVELSVHGSEASAHSHARVTRVDETPADEAWRYLVAVQLDEELPQSLLEDGVSVAARILGPSSNRPAPA